MGLTGPRIHTQIYILIQYLSHSVSAHLPTCLNIPSLQSAAHTESDSPDVFR